MWLNKFQKTGKVVRCGERTRGLSPWGKPKCGPVRRALKQVLADAPGVHTVAASLISGINVKTISQKPNIIVLTVKFLAYYFRNK